MWLSSLSDAERHALMRLAHNVVVSDGLLDPNEEGMLNEFRLEMELTQSGEFEYLELDGIETVFVSRQARIIVLLNLLKLSYADGAFEVEEECLLKEVSRAFAVSDEEFMLLNNWTRRLNALEVEARDLMDLPG
jgi:tellurite resistance protein